MKRTFTHLLLVAGLVLTGCEGAKAPLGAEDEVALDSRLIGTWIGLDDDGDESSLTISALNESEYELALKDSNSDDAETMRMRAFASSIDGIQIANITCLICEKDEEEEWFFFAFELESDDVLVATALDDDVYNKGLKDLTSSTEIRAYVTAHIKDSSFFEDESGRFHRKKD